MALWICLSVAKADALYSTDFSTQEEFDRWTVVDVNVDQKTWSFDDGGDPSKIFYSYHGTNSADDWFISPAITPTESGTVAINYVVYGSSYVEKLEVMAGNAATVEAMTTRLSDVNSLMAEKTSFVCLLDVTANQPFHIGFHAVSDPDKWRLYLCNLSVNFTTNPVDLQTTGFVSPTSNFGLGQETVTVKVKNSGKVPVESFDLSYSIDETTVVTETVNQTLAAGEEMEYSFNAKADLSQPRKLFALKAWTSHADDINPANDACTTEVLHKAPAAVPYFMGFEASEYTDGIQILNLNEDSGDWEIYTDPWYNLARTGDYCLAYNYDKNNNANDWAILEPITIEEAGYYVLKFWYSGDDTHPEKLAVYYGNDATPEAMTNKIVEYAPFARGAYEESINIIYIDQPQTINIGFYAFSDKDENWLCVDDVTFEKIDSEAADIMAMPITNPIEYVHAGTNKDVKFKLRNVGIKDATTKLTVKVDETVLFDDDVVILAQEIKEFSVANALANLEAGQHKITVTTATADDGNEENNSQELTFTVVGAPAIGWNFEDGKMPSDFTFRVEDSGTISPSAGEEFNEYGWGIFNIGTHELYGEHMLAGTTWLEGTEKADRWLILPPFKPTEDSHLVWDVASFNPNFLESYAIMISTNGDDSWYYFTEEEYIQESADFKTRGINLSEYNGQNIYIAFRLRSKNCEHLILDNIELHGGSLVELLDVTATSDPAEGKVEKLDKFTVTFENVESVAIEQYSYYPPYIASVAEDGTLSQIASAKMTTVEGQPTQLSIEITQEGMTEITADGKYALVIPRKDLIFNGDNKLLITAKEFVFHYQIGVIADGAFPITISPAAGSTVKELQTIIFEFSAADYPNSMDYDSSKNPMLYNAAGEVVAEGHMGFADAATYMSLYVQFEAPVTEEGVYTLKVPAGAMREYGWGVANPKLCPAMELTYTVSNAEPQYTIAVTPAPSENASLKDLAQFTVTFDGVQKIDFSTEAWYAYVQRLDESGNPVEDFGTECVKISDVAYTATLTSTPTELGTYRLTIPEGAIIVLDNEGVSGPNKEATFDYVVTESGYGALPISISPASGSTVKELSTIVFEFSAADYPNTMDYDSSKSPVLYNEAGEEVAIGHMGFADAATYMSLYVTFEAPITEEGVYTLEVPAGAMREYGWGIAYPKECPAMTLTYTIGNVEPQYTITVTPAPSENVALETISEFTVTFEGVQKIDFSTEAWYAYVQLLDASGNPIQDFGAECEKISEVAYKATLMDTPTELGTYRLTIPENAIIVLDNAGVSGPNKEATFDYNVTYVSVEDILADATEFNVYSINGVCLLTNAKAEDLKQLEPGIYIINGRKVFIR